MRINILEFARIVLDFDLFPYQKRYLISLVSENYTINVSSRQMGNTTVLAVYLAYYILFNGSSKKIVILTGKDYHSNNVIRLAYSFIKVFFKIIGEDKKLIKHDNFEIQNYVTGTSVKLLNNIYSNIIADQLIIDDAIYCKESIVHEAMTIFSKKIHLISTPKKKSWFNNIFLTDNKFTKFTFKKELRPDIYSSENIANFKKVLGPQYSEVIDFELE